MSLPPPEAGVRFKACHGCGLVQVTPATFEGVKVLCRRCGTRFAGPIHLGRARSRSAAAALGALVLFFPAVTLPILEMEKLGHRHASSLLGGTFELIRHGEWLVGGVVFFFSLLFPFCKMALLLELNLWGWMDKSHQALTHRLLEWLGRWSMLDVLLLAMLVMFVKLGEVVVFRPGPALFAFVLCVIMNLVASMTFRPEAIWEEGQ